MLNQICITGRLTKKPELRYTTSNTPTTTVTLACERDYAPEGQKRTTDFIDCVVWNKAAEFVEKYFNKGDMMTVSGRLQIRNWEDREGNKRRTAEIVSEHVYFGSTRSGSGSANAGNDSGEEFYEAEDTAGGELPF